MMPPGIDAPTPAPTNPTTSSVRPGMITKSGHPYWVRSMPNMTTPSAKRPTTTSTIPRAMLDPARFRRAGCGTAVTGTAGVAGTVWAKAGSASEVDVVASPTGSGTVSTGGSGSIGSDTTAGSSTAVGSDSKGGAFSLGLDANMSGLPARMSGLTCAMSSLAAASSVSSLTGGCSWLLEVLPGVARFRLLMTLELNGRPWEEPAVRLTGSRTWGSRDHVRGRSRARGRSRPG